MINVGDLIVIKDCSSITCIAYILEIDSGAEFRYKLKWIKHSCKDYDNKIFFWHLHPHYEEIDYKVIKVKNDS